MNSSRERDRLNDRDRRHRDYRHGKDQSTRRSPERYSSDEEFDERSRRDDRNGSSSSRYRERSRSPRRDRSGREYERHHDRSRAPYNEEDDSRLHYYDDYADGDQEGDGEGFGYRHYTSKREETPNNTVMIRSLAPEITESDVVMKLSEFGLIAKDIRLMRKKDTGASRGFAFVEFTNLDEAVRWKDVTQGFVDFDTCQATLHYSVPKDNFPGGPIQKFDWTCYKCGVNNFKRRDQCFKCATTREESAANEPGEEISHTPTNCLLLQDLSTETTEDGILSVLGSLTSLPIKSIRIPRDVVYNHSRCVCFVELHTTLEATQLFTLLTNLPSGFLVDDYALTVNYAKRGSHNVPMSAGAVNAASAALAAAQWTNQSDASAVTTSRATVCVNGVTYQRYPTPDPSKFQLDKGSGYYYDNYTQLYYDAQSKYYYNGTLRQYLSWSAEYETYLPVDNGAAPKEIGQPKAAVSHSDKKEKPDNKVKSAKKIAKEMEKWAKTLNQKAARAQTAISGCSGEDAVSSARPEFVTNNFTSTESSASHTISVPEGARFNQLSAVQANHSPKVEEELEADSGFDAVVKEEESKCLDWTKLCCLLCKRQFSSTDQMTKHQTMSDLHKSNLKTRLRSVLSDEQMDWLENKDSDSYRDRAKERRRKYGQPEKAESNLMKARYLKQQEVACQELQAPVTKAPPMRLGNENIGSKMLQKMGWSEGQGLGKSNQGRTEIVEADARADGVGLGNKSSASVAQPGDSYKDAVKRAMFNRYKELDEQ